MYSTPDWNLAQWWHDGLPEHFPCLSSKSEPKRWWSTDFCSSSMAAKYSPTYTNTINNDIYLSTFWVKLPFVFIQGTARQDVTFVATLLWGTGHEWYLVCGWINGNQPPRDWRAFQQGLLDNFGSNIRANWHRWYLWTFLRADILSENIWPSSRHSLEECWCRMRRRG